MAKKNDKNMDKDIDAVETVVNDVEVDDTKKAADEATTVEYDDVDGVEVGVYHRGDEEIAFAYKNDMPIGMKVAFIDSVVDVVAGDDYYYPILKDLIFDFQLVNVLTNIEVDIEDGLTNMQQLNAIEEFMNGCDIADVLKINLDIDMLMELYEGVNRAIEYKTGIHPSPIADGIASILKVAEDKMRGFDMNSVSDLAGVFSKMQGDITPEKMLEAYANSDVFKKMANDVVEKQNKRSKAFDDAVANADKGAGFSVVE